jgi:hypothetical protein
MVFKSVSMKQGCQVVINVIEGRAGERASLGASMRAALRNPPAQNIQAV